VLDVAVVGAGVGGLSAAITLAAQGRSVQIFEAAEAPGGKAGIVSVDGVEVDTGPTLLTLPEVFLRIADRAGMRAELERMILRPDPSFRYIWPDGVVLDVHHRLQDTLASVRRTLGPPAERDLAAFLAYAAGIWAAGSPAFVLGDAPSVGRIVAGGLRGLKDLARVDAWRTMWDAITSRVASPHLRELLARFATYCGSDPRRAPATLNCIAHVEMTLGCYAVAGGTYELVRLLSRAAARVGVEVALDTPVRRLVLDGRRVVGVELDGGRIVRARAVVANADAAHVAGGLLPPDRARQIPASEPPSSSGFNLILRAATTTAPRAAHTVLFPSRYLAEFEDVFDRGRPPRSPAVYLCTQSVANRRRRWPDHEPIFVMATAPPEPLDAERDGEAWASLEAEILGRLRRAGLTSAADTVVWRRTPGDLARRFPGTRGAIYGSASHSLVSAFRRPPNVVEGVRGLYLASGSAHPGGGLPLVALSGEAAARAVMRDTHDVLCKEAT
jgi:phytoene desaturase